MKQPTRIGTIVSLDPTLNALVKRAEELRGIDAVVRDWLPELLRDKVQVAVTRGDTLVLTASSAVWATRLRYEVPELLEKARQTPALSHIARILVRVDTPR